MVLTRRGIYRRRKDYARNITSIYNKHDGSRKNGNNLPDKFNNIIPETSLVIGVRSQITYETLHKVWSMLKFSFLGSTQLDS